MQPAAPMANVPHPKLYVRHDNPDRRGQGKKMDRTGIELSESMLECGSWVTQDSSEEGRSSMYCVRLPPED